MVTAEEPREWCRGRGNGSGLWRVGGSLGLVEADYGESSRGIGFGVGLDDFFKKIIAFRSWAVVPPLLTMIYSNVETVTDRLPASVNVYWPSAMKRSSLPDQTLNRRIKHQADDDE